MNERDLKTVAARISVGSASISAPIVIGIFVPNEIIIGAILTVFLLAVAYLLGWSIIEWIKEARWP